MKVVPENIIFISGPDDESGMFEDLEHLKEFALKTGGYTEEEIEEVFERDSEDIVIISPALGYSGKVANPMTVKELVKRLLTMPQGLEVVVAENLLDFDVKQGYEIERGVYHWNKPEDVDNTGCVILKEIYAFYRNSNFTMDLIINNQKNFLNGCNSEDKVVAQFEKYFLYSIYHTKRSYIDNEMKKA